MPDALPAELAAGLSLARALAITRCPDPQERDDAVSEASLAVLRCWKRFDREKAQFNTYAGDSALLAVFKHVERCRWGGRRRADWLRRHTDAAGNCPPLPADYQPARSLSEQVRDGNGDSVALGELLPGAPPAADWSDLYWAVGMLPPPLAEAVTLCYFDELSQSAAARVVGVSQMQISRRLKLALRMLRGLMGQEGL
jgi:DNA-directed RNA polymerase specialized sigma24 family protein